MDLNEIAAPLKALVMGWLDAKFFFGRSHPYSVAAFDKTSNTADLEPVSSDYKFMAKVPVRTPGIQLVLAKGDSVLVSFEGSDPNKPYISFCNYASSYTKALAVARQGDMVGIPVNLIAAVSPVGAPIPGVYCLAIPVPPPGLIPNVGGPCTLYGVVNSGSPFAKIK